MDASSSLTVRVERRGDKYTLLSHKFHVGQLVQVVPTISRRVPGGSYEIIRKLLESHGEFEYRIKSMNEAHERVARESELQASHPLISPDLRQWYIGLTRL